MSFTSVVRSVAAPALALALLASALPALAEGDAPAPAARKVVNVNQASAAELARLPRVGEKLAERIVAYRQEHGPFKRAEGLMEVKGIGEKMFAVLEPYVALSGQTTLTEKVSKAKGRSGSKASKTARASGSGEPGTSGR
ncbi:helix-hairpin-helix domain-containing protein [Acidobacteria bacterium ACD]|nr:helix-hairpin-helix domain-containing protein [Acidobacteria bacterium ACB2]MDL1948638.1 helix-hairpin-helix domain-containing protein [Acidobacteria bacterium ACD]